MAFQPVYMDYNATTPCDPAVVAAMLPYFSQHFGNAASHNHSYGWEAGEAVKIAREQLADLIGAEPNEIIFTSGATEAINLALKGVFEKYARKGAHIITAPTEHMAVLDTCSWLEKRGAEITVLPVDHHGMIDLQVLEASIRTDTILICLMLANNETGVIFPVRQISEIARKHRIVFFTDATQAVGKIAVDVQEDGIDIMCCSSHKIYGPKGVGALYVRRKDPRVTLAAQMQGGGHEKGLRSGTLNVPGIVGMGKAAEICLGSQNEEGKRLSGLRDMLEREMLAIPGAVINGAGQPRLPQVANICFDGHSGVLGITGKIALSSGSACTSALPAPSHVLKAMGLSDEAAASSLRFSLGRFTTEEEVRFAVEEMNRFLSKIEIPR
ncbi:MAG: cysteine desulfurase [Gemmatimonadaceae bacterium]|nr:cysteine desulfurase [Chitinophagaceae bacterium]